jgi:hypothetical protein
MGETSTRTGLFNAIFTALADTLMELGGYIVTRSKTTTNLAGATTLTVESTDRFPEPSAITGVSRLAVDGYILLYTGKTSTTFTGITDESGVVGLPATIWQNKTVMGIGRDVSQFDDLRASMIVATAEDVELDMIGRNYGIARPRGTTDAQFRALLQAMIYLEAQTIYGIEQVMEAIYGAGNYEVYEDLEDFPHKVFVQVAPLPTTQSRGKTYVVGLEPQDTTGAFTVDVDNPPGEVYGAWLQTDPGRSATNYANEPFVSSTQAANDRRVYGPGAFFFTAADIEKPVTLTRASGQEEHWRVEAVDAGGSWASVYWRSFTNGTVNGASPDRLVVDNGRFPAWVVGHDIEISNSGVGNDGTYVIAEVISHKEVRLTGAAFVTESDVEWRLFPNFPTEANSAEIPRATVVGNTVTLPQSPGAAPVAIFVDYIHVLSAELMEDEDIDGNDANPFYLWDETAVARALLDLITAAGVIPEVEI